MNARDKRVSLMNEVLQSVRMIKYMAFERPFEERILVSREYFRVRGRDWTDGVV